VAQVQFELGHATSFEHRPIQIEQMLCHRYFWKIRRTIQTRVYNPSTASQTNYIHVQLPTQMRIVPTVTFSTNTQTAGTTVASTNVSIDGFEISQTSTAVGDYSVSIAGPTGTSVNLSASAEL
jgi:hypothetical protein